MKRKFVKVMFFGALALSTVTYVGCKDYDDDVKSLQEQIDNINSKGADVTTEAMTAAINSAIAKVQADLDKIAGKADKSALDALQTVVTNLQNAVNGKADSSKLESLKTELNAAIAAVNASIQPAINEAKGKLEGQISALEGKLETADDEIRNSIVEQIAGLKTELQDLMNANAEEYAKLYAKKADFDLLTQQVEVLAKIKHLTTADVLTFIKTDAEVKEYIDGEFVALLQENLENPESALLAYLDGTFTTQIMTKVTSKCNDIVDTKMDALRLEWTNYQTAQGEKYNDIVRRLNALEDYKLSAIQTLYDELTDPKNNTIEKANLCATALGDITNLSEEFGKYTTTTDLEANYVKNADLNKKIGDYVDSKISALDTRVETLEANLKTLQEGLSSMLKSLVFAPQYYDAGGELIRSVSFTSVYTAKTASAEAIAISAPTSVEVNFRVSPASAVADLIGDHPKYTISTNKHVITSRAVTDDGILTVESVKQAKDDADQPIDGMITVTLNAAKALKSYALSLSVQGNNEANKPITNFTEITSDYFAAIVSKRYINSVDYVAKAYSNPELLIDKSGSSIEFYKKENDKDNIKIKLSDSENGTNPDANYTSLSKLGLSTSLFKVEFEKDGADPDYFVLDENYVLKVNQEKLPASSRYNKTCTVTPKITVTTTAMEDDQPVKVDYAGSVVNAKIVAEGVNLEYAVADLHWKDAPQTVNLGSEELAAIFAKIKEVSGNDSYPDLAAAVAAATSSSIADGGVTIASTNGNVTITIPAKTVGGADKVFTPTLTLTYANSAIVNIAVGIKVLAPDVMNLKLGANTVNWNGSSVVEMMPSADAKVMSALTVSRKLSEVLLKSDADAINAAVVANTVKLKVVDGEDNDVSASVAYPSFEVEQPTASNKEVSYKFSLYYTMLDGTEVSLKDLVTVKLKPSVKVAGTITAPVPAKRTISHKKLTDTYDLTTDFTWKDFRGVTLWPTFAAAADGNTISAPTTYAHALSIYSGKVEYIVDSADRNTFVNCFNTDDYDSATGIISNAIVKLNDTFQGQSGSIANAITVKIHVKASTSWGAPVNDDTVLTITYPANTGN